MFTKSGRFLLDTLLTLEDVELGYDTSKQAFIGTTDIQLYDYDNTLTFFIKGEETVSQDVSFDIAKCKYSGNMEVVYIG